VPPPGGKPTISRTPPGWAWARPLEKTNAASKTNKWRRPADAEGEFEKKANMRFSRSGIKTVHTRRQVILQQERVQPDLLGRQYWLGPC
jgi:hypothetical protein